MSTYWFWNTFDSAWPSNRAYYIIIIYNSVGVYELLSQQFFYIIIERMVSVDCGEVKILKKLELVHTYNLNTASFKRCKFNFKA